MPDQVGDQGHNPTAHLDLMPTDSAGTASGATHVAINNGDWFNPGTWSNGQVPGDGALVHIPAGVTVSYEGASDAQLFMVRVDGALKMYAENGIATKMIVDTMITSDNSKLVIDAGDASDGTVDLVFAEATPAANSAYYTDASAGDGVIGRYAWDPEQLSLGLVASGKVVVKGQEVDSGLQLTTGPQAGDTQIVFDASIGDTGWAIGQSIVVGGTTFLGDDADGQLITQDEVRKIADIQEVDGQMIVTLDSALEHDHRGPLNPLTGEELTGYVGNLSRNVTVSSNVADLNGDGQADRGVSLGETLGENEHYVTERGHVMFMHNDDVSVLNTSFFGLGRSDKAVLLDDKVTGGIHDFRLHSDGGVIGEYDPATDLELETEASAILNQRGRYAVHLHEANMTHSHGDDDSHDMHGHSDGAIGPCPETGGPICQCSDQDGDGIADSEDPDYFEGAYLSGNVVWGTPGWGIVQHSSDAAMENNVVYDAAGAAFVAELGDERGYWKDNLAIGTYGVRELEPNQDAEAFNEDDGASGVGFYLKSRAIELEDNAAVSSGRLGFFWHTNGWGLKDVQTPDGGVLETVAQGRDTIPAEDVPILVFDGNTVIAAREGARIVTDPHDAVRKFNDVWSKFDNFTAWEVDESGMSVTYSSKYIFSNFLILGTETKISEIAQQSSAGFFFKVSASDMTIIDSHIENFDNAVTNWSMVGDRQEYRRGYWDPKDPTDYQWIENTEGMGAVEGIENPVYNLWNTNIVNVTYDNLNDGWLRASNITVDMGDGTTDRFQGVQVLDSAEDAPGTAGVEIELLGDSRDGGLVALWREDIPAALATSDDPSAILAQHIPLAYQETVFLGQVHYADGRTIRRNDYLDFDANISADIWSGTILEFAKEDSLGRQVFLYGDFSPLDPSAIERTVTTNERLVISKEMIDGTLSKNGYYVVQGIDDVKFVVVDVIFTERLTGELQPKRVVIALDIAWVLPEDAFDAGILHLTNDTIVAPQYRVFNEGVLVQDRAPIVLGEAPEGLSDFETGVFATEDSDDIALSAETDRVNASGGDDVLRGFGSADYLDGGDGDDALFGGQGWDRLTGGDGNDVLSGHTDRDFLYGGNGDDQLQGALGRDYLDGGNGADAITAGNGNDEAYGGAGNDIIDGGNHKDSLFGGDGDDQLVGNQGFDTLFGGAGDDVLSGNAGVDVLYGGTGDDLMNGGARADDLFGGDGADVLQGDAGMDELYGGVGNDLVEGQMGTDALYGGDGDDALLGGAGRDTLFGGDGNDTLSGGQAQDQMTGGAGADRFVFDEETAMDVITDFEDGVDAIEFMIEAFGFEDLEVLQDGDDALITHPGGEIRLVSVDGTQLDESDFVFTSPG